MKTLRVPFQLDPASGGLLTTTDQRIIIEQQIKDILATNYGERLMNPTYGANLQELLFSQAQQEAVSMKRSQLVSLLSVQVTLADIVGANAVVGTTNDSTITITILYRIKPGNEVFSVQHTVSGIVTQETVF